MPNRSTSVRGTVVVTMMSVEIPHSVVGVMLGQKPAAGFMFRGKHGGRCLPRSRSSVAHFPACDRWPAHAKAALPLLVKSEGVSFEPNSLKSPKNHVVFRQALRHRRISVHDPTMRQMLREIGHSLCSIAIFGLVTIVIAFAALTNSVQRIRTLRIQDFPGQLLAQPLGPRAQFRDSSWIAP